MTSIDEQFVEFIVKSLVGAPGEVSIERTIDEKGVLLELTVDPEDLGRVIGKRGATAQSIRTLLRALGTKNDARYNLKIVDNGVAPAKRDNDDKPADQPKQDEDSVEETPKQEEPSAVQELKEELDDDDDESQDDKSDQEESLADRTRKELDDLDDLDI